MEEMIKGITDLKAAFFAKQSELNEIAMKQKQLEDQKRMIEQQRSEEGQQLGEMERQRTEIDRLCEICNST
jgi:septal ring factor EnvC (AmiA/AmiB activator)